MNYDVVVVGAGSAGCVLADRLSADRSNRVLLIEAGGSAFGFNVDVPAAFSKLYKSERDWAYHTMPEPGCASRQLYIPRGKMLGGSSSMNAMLYIRGSRRDYDGWAEAGCAGWSYEEVLPYFIRAESNERLTDEYHGRRGPLNVADPRSPHPLSVAFVEACVQAGLPASDDFNGALQSGAGLYQCTQKNGRRWSAWNAYLQPAMNRPNLTVLTGALAHRVLFTDGRAIGVEYSSGRNVERAYGAEIILAGGAINTPQLLMLSGIGEADTLRDIGIDVVVDNPNVGRHLQDHPAVGQVHQVSRTDTLVHAESVGALANFIVRRRGPLTSTVAEAGAFTSSRPELEAPDIQFHFAPAVFLRHGFETREEEGMTIGPTLLAPASRGTIRLRSADPSIHPDITTHALTEASDLAAMIEGFKLGRHIAAQPAFETLVIGEMVPGRDAAQTDDEIGRHIRGAAELLYHPACTARMGPDESEAVVDPSLRVFGVSGLRVVDASVMPTIVRGNLNAPTIMIAEKACDLITSDIAHVPPSENATSTSA